METPNIQLYNLFRFDLCLSNGKSLELMHLLDKEYKSGVKEDIATLGKSIDARFEKIDARFEKLDARFEKIDARFEKLDGRVGQLAALDSKIDVKTAELRADIHKSRAVIVTWMLGIILTILALFIASLFKK